MSKLFTKGAGDFAIKLINTEYYDHWLNKQSPFIVNWLASQEYKGKGAQTVPNVEGKIDFILFGASDWDTLFLAEDISIQLPPHDYYLDISSLEGTEETKNTQDISLRFAISWGLAAYRYERYKQNDKAQPSLAINDEAIYKQAVDYVNAITLVRDLINAPASDLMPEHMSEECTKLATQFGATITEIIGDDLLTQNYPTIHAVGRASIHAPRLIDMTWGHADHPKVTLVGKGVCFDSGGLDLKPSNFMRLMKKDMGGAAHVLGLAYLIMAAELPIRLRVLIPSVENAVSSNAFRPGDVITTRKGLTVEVDNTDAEGRLVLCDALTEAESETPDLIIDFATLTGACRVALGTELPGYFCNNDKLAMSIFESGNSVDDPVWRLPLHSPYQDMLKSDIADTLNSSPSGFGGAITAALYLQLFIDKAIPWLHFDVMAWNNRKLPGRPIGGEAFGIRAVFDYLQNTYTK